MSRKYVKANQELNDNPEPESETKVSGRGWADFIRRELKYTGNENYHRDLLLAVLCDKLERIAKCLEGRNF